MIFPAVHGGTYAAKKVQFAASRLKGMTLEWFNTYPRQIA